MLSPFNLFVVSSLLWVIPISDLTAQAVLQGTVSFLNSGSRPAVGVDISAFGASTVPTTESGMFILKFPDKKPGDKVKIIVGSKDRNGISLELVNDKVLAQVRIPSKPDDDLVEIIVCKVGQRNEAALRYNGIIVKTVNDTYEKNIKEINQKLTAQNTDATTLFSLQREKEKLTAERDSAIAKAEEQALFMANINLDKASKLVKEAISKVDSLQDILSAINVLDNEILLKAYEEASEKKKKAEIEISQVIAGFEFKTKLLQPFYRYSEIAECFEKISTIYEKEGYTKEDVADNLNEAAYYWGLSGNYQKALESNLKALAIREEILPVDHPDLAKSYGNVSSNYSAFGDYKKQLEYNLKALSIREKILPANHLDLALSYNNLVLNYNNIGEYQKAIEYSFKAIAIRSKILPQDHTYLAISYNNLSLTYYNLGEHQKELEYNLKALAIWEKALPPNHPDLALSYGNVASTYYNIGDYQKSLDLNLKTLAIREKVLPPGHSYLAISYNNTGRSYREVGEYQKAIEYSQKAISIAEASNTRNPRLNIFYTNLGITFAKANQYPEAKSALEKSERLKADKLVYQGWALFYSLQDKRTDAIENLQKAISMGLKDLNWLKNEQGLKNIRKEREYKNIIEQMKKNQQK